jgi:hypothetical protein
MAVSSLLMPKFLSLRGAQSDRFLYEQDKVR